MRSDNPGLADRKALLATALAVALALMAVSASPAEAKSSSQYRETGRAASTYWEQVDDAPIGGQFGNVHIGYLTAYETTSGRASAFGWIEDYDCEEGEKPGGGHAAEEVDEVDAACDWIGERWLEGDDLSFSMDNKMATATLKGQLVAYGGGHGESGPVGRPMADIVWTGTGGTYTSKYTSRYRDGDTSSTETWSSTERSATVSGTLGPMGFDPDLSGGSLSSYKTSYRSRTK